MSTQKVTEESSTTPTLNLTLDQLKDLLGSSKSLTKDEQLELIQAQADANAKAQKALLKPELATTPGISSYSYPEGDAARPRPKLRCETFWLNMPMLGDVDTAEEIELINQITFGDYICMRPDGTPMKVTVTGEADPISGAYKRMMVWFPTKQQGGKSNVFSKAMMLREMLAQTAAKVA